MKGFASLPGLLVAARRSKFRLWLLNLLLGRLIPFNRPHGVRIRHLTEDRVETTAPYRRRNLNHLRGIHACCIATVAEFSSGLLFLSRLNPNRYRLIMAGMEVEYHYQARGSIVATSCLSDAELKNRVLQPLDNSDQVLTTLSTEVHDPEGHLVATARITWQIKAWDKVQTRVA
jgi:acyl-coenzyme A thioesterase PaaI-like protein